MKRKSDLAALEVTSQDPLQFCMKIKHELGHAIDPEIVCDPKIESMRRFLFINQGWRLTHRGFNLLLKYYQSYASQNPTNEVVIGRVLISMDCCIGGPWFMRGRHVFVFNDTAHFELEMVNGDVRTYVDFRNPK